MPALAKRSGRIGLGAVVVGSLLGLGTAATANPTVDFNISVFGGTGGPFNTLFNQVGTNTATPGVYNYHSPVGGIVDPSGFNEWSISVWDFNADDSPDGSGAATGAKIGSGFTVTNNRPDDVNPAANHLQFSILVSVPINPVTAGTTFFGNGGMTLNITANPFNNPGVLSTNGGPIWNYQVNGADVASLFPTGFNLGGSGPGTNSTSANLSAGQMAGLVGLVPSSLGIRLDFDLTPGETVTFNGLFGFVPTPGALSLLGLAGLAGFGRRRRS